MTQETTTALPELTEGDLHVILSALATLTYMGATVIGVRESRMRLILDAAIRFGVLPADVLAQGSPFDPVGEGETDRTIEICVRAPNSPHEHIPVLLKVWKPCSKPDCPGCQAIVASERLLPVPEARGRVWTPN